MMMQELRFPARSGELLIFFIQAVALLLIVLGFVTYVILAERKVLGFMQSDTARTGSRDVSDCCRRLPTF